jgi:hypothetical protein
MSGSVISFAVPIVAMVALRAAYALGHHHGRLKGEEAAKTRKWDACVHNVCGVVAYPKGDRYTCLDCGDTLD